MLSIMLSLFGVVSETEGCIWKIQKGHFFTMKQLKRAPLNLTSSYIHGLFTIVLIKQIFEKNKLLRAASRNWTQFKPEINPDVRALGVTV